MKGDEFDHSKLMHSEGCEYGKFINEGKKFEQLLTGVTHRRVC